MLRGIVKQGWLKPNRDLACFPIQSGHSHHRLTVITPCFWSPPFLEGPEEAPYKTVFAMLSYRILEMSIRTAIAHHSSFEVPCFLNECHECELVVVNKVFERSFSPLIDPRFSSLSTNPILERASGICSTIRARGNVIFPLLP